MSLRFRNFSCQRKVFIESPFNPMCKISGKLKLCTFAAKNPDSLKHYWVLKRPHKRDEQMMGLIIMPVALKPEDVKHNKKELNDLLNGGTCFDVVFDIKEKDILELHFSCAEGYLAYAFKFKDGEWKFTKYDPFTNADEVDAGKISRPFVW